MGGGSGQPCQADRGQGREGQAQRESPLCGERLKQHGQHPKVCRGMDAEQEKLLVSDSVSDSRVLMWEDGQCQCLTRARGKQV